MEIARVGTWGTDKAGGPQNKWSFQLERDHKMKQITIDHGELIYSLTFTSQDPQGGLHTSDKFGGWNGGSQVSEVIFDNNEEIVGITGTVGVSTGEFAGYTIISSISFITNKTTHGPFGQATGTAFSVPWENGAFAGFYGLAGYYIDSIGVYLRVPIGTAKVGTWGTDKPGGPQNQWSFQLERGHKLKKIQVDHGELIYSLMFTSEDPQGGLHPSEKAGGWNGGSQVSEVTFDVDEEIIGITGTVGVSTREFAGYTIISSISFITNKTTHGPFGQATGTAFSVPWENGAFAGFYGLAGYYIDSIGVYLWASTGTTKVGTWGTDKPGGPQNQWSFQLENGHKLKKIQVDHGELIYSLMFTSEDPQGGLHPSDKAGGWNGGSQVSEVTFDVDEEIIGITGTIGVSTGEFAGYTIISSISFITNKTTHGPFGQATGSAFSVPWENGVFGGFYGLAGYYIDSIGVYLRAPIGTAKVGTWGTDKPGGPQNHWSFQLESGHKLKKIQVDHGELIYSLMFTSEDTQGGLHPSEKAGGWNGGSQVSEVTFDVDEEIISITGTVGVSTGEFAGYTIISSISFITNKTTHGPFGQATGTAFSVPWKKGAFAGFYGLAGYYIDSIGVYLKATM